MPVRMDCYTNQSIFKANGQAVALSIEELQDEQY
jgi:hypothetical protein